MTKPVGYDGPSIEIVLKDQKADKDEIDRIVQETLKQNIVGKKVAIFQKNEQLDGPLSESVMGVLEKNFEPIEMKDFMSTVHRVKIDEEVRNIKVAAMGRTIFPNKARAVDSEGNIQFLDGHIMDKLIISTLQKCRVNRYHWLRAFTGQTCGQRYGMLLGNSHIESTIGHSLHHDFQ